MSRTNLRTRTAIAAALAVTTAPALTAEPAGAHATTPRGASGHQFAFAETSTALPVHDPRGDLVARTGGGRDTDNSPDGFKPGKGTVIPATAADRAMDLTKAVYRTTGGKRPALQVTYHVPGPIHFAHHFSEDNSVPGQTTEGIEYDYDAFETILGGGRYTLEITSMDDGMYPAGLYINNGRHRLLSCRGIVPNIHEGARKATESIPLSCLTAHGIKASTLRPASAHVILDHTTTFPSSHTSTSGVTGPHDGFTVTVRGGSDTYVATVGSDIGSRTWRVDFTNPII